MTQPTDPTRATTERQQEPRDTDESSTEDRRQAIAEIIWTAIDDCCDQGMTRADSIRKGLEALSLLSPEGGGKAAAWQPIENYAPPTSGRPAEVLLLLEGGSMRVARYNHAISSRTPAWWASAPGLYHLKPTHYMPLPQPPVGEQ